MALFMDAHTMGGPVTLDVLRRMAASGQLQPPDLVWMAGMASSLASNRYWTSNPKTGSFVNLTLSSPPESVT